MMTERFLKLLVKLTKYEERPRHYFYRNISRVLDILRLALLTPLAITYPKHLEARLLAICGVDVKEKPKTAIKKKKVFKERNLRSSTQAETRPSTRSSDADK